MSFKEQLNKLKDNWLIIVLVVIAFLALTFLVSNGTSYSSAARNSFAMNDSVMYSKSMVPGYGGYVSDFAPEIEDRKIVTNSNLSLEVKGGDFSLAESKVKAIVSSTDSLILNERQNINKNGNRDVLYGSYTIKVNSLKLDSIVSQLKEIGKVTSFNQGSDDITGNYTNKEIELEVENERLKRYQEMYTQANKISDKIDLNDRIFNQERKIKYIQDSLKNMDQRVDYSTIYLDISEKYSYSNIALVKLSDLVRSFVNSVNALLKFLFVIIPFAIVGWIIYLVTKKNRKIKKK